MTFDDHIRHIHPDVLLSRMEAEDLDIIDIREPHELRELPFPGARNIPTNLLVMFHDEFLNKDSTYYILCHHGQRSYRVTELLQNMGYHVINVIGGIDLVSRV
jgi:rhodanese-related sulfurtransferase